MEKINVRCIYDNAQPGEDPHRKFAAALFNKPAAEVTQEERQYAKTQAYFILYS